MEKIDHKVVAQILGGSLGAFLKGLDFTVGHFELSHNVVYVMWAEGPPIEHVENIVNIALNTIFNSAPVGKRLHFGHTRVALYRVSAVEYAQFIREKDSYAYLPSGEGYGRVLYSLEPYMYEVIHESIRVK